jgi:hypothetical protein
MWSILENRIFLLLAVQYGCCTRWFVAPPGWVIWSDPWQWDTCECTAMWMGCPCSSIGSQTTCHLPDIHIWQETWRGPVKLSEEGRRKNAICYENKPPQLPRSTPLRCSQSALVLSSSTSRDALRYAPQRNNATTRTRKQEYHAVPTYRQHPPTGTQKKSFPIQNAQFHLHSIWSELKLLAWNNVCCIGKFVPSDIITLLFWLRMQYGRTGLM